jgi:hypothetical protein
MNRRRIIYFGGAGSAAIAATVVGLALAGHGPAHAATQQNRAVQAASVQPAASTSQAAPATAADPDTVNDTTTPDTSAPEPAGAAESATASDAPGGHEDNPADPNAAHDFQGNE